MFPLATIHLFVDCRCLYHAIFDIRRSAARSIYVYLLAVSIYGHYAAAPAMTRAHSARRSRAVTSGSNRLSWFELILIRCDVGRPGQHRDILGEDDESLAAITFLASSQLKMNS